MRNIRTLETFLIKEQEWPKEGFWLWKFLEMTGAQEIPWSVFVSIARKCRSLSINDGDDVYYERDIDEESVSVTKEVYGEKPRWLTFMKHDNLTVPITGDASLMAKEGTDELKPYDLAFIFYFKSLEEVIDFLDGETSWIPNKRLKSELTRSVKSKRLFGI